MKLNVTTPPRRTVSIDGGFTLIEMLLVMAVIGVLMGFLLPAVMSARERGRRTQCTEQLRQIAMALDIYAMNSGNYLPSYPGYGLPTCDIGPIGAPFVNYGGHQGVCRHMVIAYGEDTGAELSSGRLNFMAVGLGILVEERVLDDPLILSCPSMGRTATTYYGSSAYEYDSAVWRKLGGIPGKQFQTGDGSDLHHTPATDDKVTAILCSYAYRNQPFYCRQEPDNWADHPNPPNPVEYNDSTLLDWSDPDDRWSAAWELRYVKPGPTYATFMMPAFKTRKQLRDRAIVADSFDYASPTISGTFSNTEGLGESHHEDGYNVVFGDGHATWYGDSARTIAGWTDWQDTGNLGADNLTIASPSAHEVWHVFDCTAGIDTE